MELQAVDILRILPHRYPFLLVDRISEIEPGVRAVGQKNVTVNENFFVGHFPGNPIMPGVLIIEMMAQVGGVMLRTHEKYQDKQAYITGVERCRFRKPVIPGDVLVAEVTLLRARGGMGKVRAVARVGDVLACEAELYFALVTPNGETGPLSQQIGESTDEEAAKAEAAE